ncbi:L-talarate/galactarate dehydratase [soil metagenome]
MTVSNARITASPAVEVGRIARLQTRTISARPLLSWGEPVDRLHFVIATVTTDRGFQGTGFSWVPHVGRQAIDALLRFDIGRAVYGWPAQPVDVWNRLRMHLREAGSGGLCSIAMAALDLALWDLTAKSVSMSVSQLLGGGATTCPAYTSGINFHFSDDELHRQVQSWVTAGATAVKVKVGHENLGDDQRRLTIVRTTIGPDRKLMVDANQRWSLTQALHALDAIEEFDVDWIEEPLNAHDLDGYVSLAAASAIPIALGENLYHEYEFERFMAAGACAVIQPNIVRVGGITPFMRLGQLASEHGIRLVPHLLPEVSGPLVSTLPQPTMVEMPDGALFDERGILQETGPVQCVGDAIEIDHRAGLGLEFVSSV